MAIFTPGKLQVAAGMALGDQIATVVTFIEDMQKKLQTSFSISDRQADDFTVQKDLVVNQDEEIHGGLAVSGEMDVGGGVNLGGDLVVTGDLTVVNGTLKVKQWLAGVQQAQIYENFLCEGNTQLGDDPAVDTLTVNSANTAINVNSGSFRIIDKALPVAGETLIYLKAQGVPSIFEIGNAGIGGPTMQVVISAPAASGGQLLDCNVVGRTITLGNNAGFVNFAEWGDAEFHDGILKVLDGATERFHAGPTGDVVIAPATGFFSGIETADLTIRVPNRTAAGIGHYLNLRAGNASGAGNDGGVISIVPGSCGAGGGGGYVSIYRDDPNGATPVLEVLQDNAGCTAPAFRVRQDNTAAVAMAIRNQADSENLLAITEAAPTVGLQALFNQSVAFQTGAGNISLAPATDVLLKPTSGVVRKGTQCIYCSAGGDIQAIINAIIDAGPTKMYEITLGPGVHDAVVTLKPYIYLKGDSAEATRLTSSTDVALTLDSNSGVSDIAVVSNLATKPAIKAVGKNNLTIKNVNTDTTLPTDASLDFTNCSNVSVVMGQHNRDIKFNGGDGYLAGTGHIGQLSVSGGAVVKERLNERLNVHPNVPAIAVDGAGTLFYTDASRNENSGTGNDDCIKLTNNATAYLQGGSLASPAAKKDINAPAGTAVFLGTINYDPAKVILAAPATPLALKLNTLAVESTGDLDLNPATGVTRLTPNLPYGIAAHILACVGDAGQIQIVPDLVSSDVQIGAVKSGASRNAFVSVSDAAGTGVINILDITDGYLHVATNLAPLHIRGEGVGGTVLVYSTAETVTIQTLTAGKDIVLDPAANVKLTKGIIDTTEGGVNAYRGRYKNKTGAPSVKGLALKGMTGTAFGLALYSRVGGDTITRMLAASEEAGIADGTYHNTQLVDQGKVVEVYFSEVGGVAAGEYAVADAGNAGQFTGEVAAAATHTLGIIQETTGAAGLAKVLVDKQ